MSSSVLADVEIKAIKETIESFTRCLEAKDFKSWASYWEKDGTLMPPGRSRVVGHKALVDFMQDNFGKVDSVALSEWNVFGEGGLAVATTNVQWTAEGEKPAEAVKQVIVLNKDEAGKWHLRTIIFNAGV